MPGNVAPVADEREALTGFLAQQRYVLRLTAYGLTDDEARATPTVSSLCIGGLIKHATAVERSWMGTVLQQPRPARREEDYTSHFRFEPDDKLPDLLDAYENACGETDRIIASVDDLGQAVPVPKGVPWFPQDIDAWSVRWVLLHLIQETARHVGHADIIRESIDGGTAFPIMAAAESWPASPWMEPWKRKDQTV